mmetsp:Transcript_26105/g.104454  ORF Transcript_26105/g.104454 Transcript_26105/m.104454 type:complete len:115 (-) Transcript_26105:190-534(-)
MVARVVLVVLAAAAALVQGFTHLPATPRGPTRTVAYGKNDKRTRIGKIIAGTSGKARPKHKKRDGVVDPYYTLREWGKRQDPPLSVEEVIDLKMAKLTKKELTQEELLASVKPI